MGLALERLPDWPVAMIREMALAYTGVANAQQPMKPRDGSVALWRVRPRSIPSRPPGAGIAQQRRPHLGIGEEQGPHLRAGRALELRGGAPWLT